MKGHTMDLKEIDRLIAKVATIGNSHKPLSKAKNLGMAVAEMFVGRLVGDDEIVQAITYWTYESHSEKKSYWEIITYNFTTNKYLVRRKWGKGSLAKVTRDGLLLNGGLGYNGMNDYSKLISCDMYDARRHRDECYDLRAKHGYMCIYYTTHRDFETYTIPRKEFK